MLLLFLLFLLPPPSHHYPFFLFLFSSSLVFYKFLVNFFMCNKGITFATKATGYQNFEGLPTL